MSEKHIDNGWHEWVSQVNPNSNTLFSRQPPSRTELLDIVSNSDPHNIWLAAILIEGGSQEKTYFANAHIGPIDWIDRKCGFGRLIGDSSMRGRGLGTKLTMSILQYCFLTLGMNKVTTLCSELNIPAHKSNIKAGMECEGILRKDRYQNGRYLDSHIFSAWFDSWENNSIE